MENHDYFSGALRFNILFLILDIVLIFHFFIAWYLSYKKTGWAVDPWNFGLLMTYFFPFLLLYPFASAIPNVFAVGTHIHAIQGSINQAYFISLVGYMSFFLGSIIFKKFKTRTFIFWIAIMPIKQTIGKIYKTVLVNRDTTKFIFFIYCGVLTAMLLVAFKAGSFSNPRAYFYKNEGIRPYYNFTVSLSGIVSGIIIARIFQFNMRSDKIYLAFFIFVNLFIGSRSFALGPLAGVFTLMVFLVWKGRFKIKQMAVYGGIILSLVVILGQFRSSNHAKPVVTVKGPNPFLTEILYGNSFSDLRDFAWCLSAWDQNYFYGKTYLSAYISFVPTTLSSFRTEYNIGRITAKLGGFDPKDHPGLRPGMFGESYLNFGLIGVIIIGIIMGYAARYMDYKAKLAAYSNDKLEYFVSGIGTLLVGSLAITSGFFAVYTLVFVIILLFALRLVFKAFKSMV